MTSSSPLSNLKPRRPVRTLSPEVARKIAAGEVIDRPNAIVRELLDNAVDSGADSISVEIEGGGIDRIRISDNGYGMTKEDLLSCARPHATSKITDAADLMKLTTLGFRGEALASIAAVSRLSIASGNWKMRASLTEDHILEQIPLVQNGQGTIVMSEGLFENYPARRVFLKRPASETLMCRETFVEKALARTDIHFRLTIDKELRLDLQKGVSPEERFVSALELKYSPERFALLKAENGDEWKFTLVIGESDVYRTDRKQIFIYVNGRRVQEYSLLQAIEYGCQGFFPNGTHPVAALFAEVNPGSVDFNIHPAKKEVRFKDISGLHHGVSSTVKQHFSALGIKSSQEYEAKDLKENSDLPGFDFSYSSSSGTSLKINEPSASGRGSLSSDYSPSYSYSKKVKENDLRSRFFNYEKSSSSALASMALSFDSADKITQSEKSSSNGSTQNGTQPESGIFTKNAPQFTQSDKDGFSYIGTVLNCFLLAQVKDTLYFIDQHAAHERILFNKIMETGTEKQNLLIPLIIETQTEEESNAVKQSLNDLEKTGFTGKQTAEGRFEFTTSPARWKGTEEDLKTALLDKMQSPKDILYSVAAMSACRSAVMDGDILDRAAAEKLARQALELPDPHCPHGRPVWTTLSKEQLFARVRRTI